MKQDTPRQNTRVHAGQGSDARHSSCRSTFILSSPPVATIGFGIVLSIEHSSTLQQHLDCRPTFVIGRAILPSVQVLYVYPDTGSGVRRKYNVPPSTTPPHRFADRLLARFKSSSADYLTLDDWRYGLFRNVVSNLSLYDRSPRWSAMTCQITVRTRNEGHLQHHPHPSSMLFSCSRRGSPLSCFSFSFEKICIRGEIPDVVQKVRRVTRVRRNQLPFLYPSTRIEPPEVKKSHSLVRRAAL